MKHAIDQYSSLLTYGHGVKLQKTYWEIGVFFVVMVDQSSAANTVRFFPESNSCLHLPIMNKLRECQRFSTEWTRPVGLEPTNNSRALKMMTTFGHKRVSHNFESNWADIVAWNLEDLAVDLYFSSSFVILDVLVHGFGFQVLWKVEVRRSGGSAEPSVFAFETDGKR